MKALLYKENGKLQEVPIEQIDTITNDGDDSLAVMLKNGGSIFCEIITIESDNSNVKQIADALFGRKD